MNNMAEVGLVRIRHYGNNSHRDGLKIMRISEIKRAFDIDEFIALLG